MIDARPTRQGDDPLATPEATTPADPTTASQAARASIRQGDDPLARADRQGDDPLATPEPEATTDIASASQATDPESAPPAADRSAGAHRGGDRFRRGVVSFVRRSPRMNTSQEHAMARLGSRYLVEVPHDTTSTSVAPGSPLDLPGIFGRTAPLTVEIGTGSGDVLASVASAHPDRDFIGFEVYLPSVASCLTHLERAGATNARIVVADAAAGLEHLFQPGSIDELWTFFADPWHKTRHHKRRIVNPDLARLVTTRLRPGGLWRLATDWDDYAEWMLDVLDAQPGLEAVGPGPGGFCPRWPERPLTRYERKGITAGRTIHDLLYANIRRGDNPLATPEAAAPAHPSTAPQATRAHDRRGDNPLATPEATTPANPQPAPQTTNASIRQGDDPLATPEATAPADPESAPQATLASIRQAQS